MYRNDRSFGLFEPDALLPAQFYAAFRHGSAVRGEKHLMLAVLEDALDCFQKYAFTKENHARQIFGEAYEWIHSGDRDWPFRSRTSARRWRSIRITSGADSNVGSTRPSPPVAVREVARSTARRRRRRHGLRPEQGSPVARTAVPSAAETGTASLTARRREGERVRRERCVLLAERSAHSREARARARP